MVSFNPGVVLALIALAGAVVGAVRWSYKAAKSYFNKQASAMSLEARVGRIEIRLEEVAESVSVLVADSQTNGGMSTKDQNNRIERKLDQLLLELRD